ncbi:hypothetical protein K438DRAFT_1957209 [Mycena galopus ATCC 62051]|nr:hypothetical protein K438DRAFT_1957209 [Mycena galopus ATCC 62051]
MSNWPALSAWIAQYNTPKPRQPSNITRHGFHNVSGLPLGFYTGDFLGFEWNKLCVDERPNADRNRHDLAMRYVYEQEQEYWLGGELRVFPVIRYVYRRDAELCWHEIRDYLLHQTIPFRYPPRVPGGTFHWLNEPMNSENFERMVARFEIDPDGDHGHHLNVARILERGTKRVVQHHYLDFETDFCGTVLTTLSLDHVASFSATDLIAEMRKRGCDRWYLDAEARASAAIIFVKFCVTKDISFKPEVFMTFAQSR